MSVHLELVASAADIRESIRTFNELPPEHVTLAGSMLSGTTYWVYDPDTEAFGPSKFVGFRAITAESYELARAGEGIGARFDGHVTRTAIERALGRAFQPDSDLAAELDRWARDFLGTSADDALLNVDRGKWAFISLPAEYGSRPVEYVASWKHTTYESLAKNVPFDHAGSDQYDRVASSDIVWVVTIHRERLFLVARIVVDAVLTKEEAKRRWSSVWEADYHIVAVPGTAEPLRKIDITFLVPELQFHGESERLPKDFRQSFRSLRHLTDESGKLFRQAWFEAGGGDALQLRRCIAEVDGVFDPTDEADARQRTLGSIVQRQGQQDFRRALLEAYGGKCAITGCDVEAALEAAHIRPYLGPRTNSMTNGLLLRADIHTLFDLQLLAIDPDTYTVVLSPLLRTSHYAELDGAEVHRPARESAMASSYALRLHLSECHFASAAAPSR